MTHAEWTYYHPPKAQGYGHVATPRDPLAAWAKLQSFKRRHAVASDIGATHLQIDARPEFWTPAALEPVLDTLVKLAGKPQLIPGGKYRSMPANVLTWYDFERPALEPATLQAILEIVAAAPKTVIGSKHPISFSFAFDFFWRDGSDDQRPPVRRPIRIDEPLDWGPRNPYSEIGVIARDNLFVQPLLLFPHAAGSTELRELLEDIAATLPVRLRPNHFRRALVDARGDTFRLRRV